MTVEDSFSQSDLDALSFCVSLLQSDPDATYKEARSEARVSKGLSVRRQVWAAARHKMGIGPQDEIVDAAMAHSLRPEPGRAEAPTSVSKDATIEGLVGAEEEAEPREAGSSKEPRPAWATRSPQPDDSAVPSAKSVFVDAPLSPIEFMVQHLQTTNPEASFEEVRLAAEAAGHTVYPATFGRAQALAGLLEESDQGEPIPGAPPPEPTQPPPGQPKGKIDPVAGLGAFIKAMNRSEKEHHLLRTNIEQMLETIRRGLGK